MHPKAIQYTVRDVPPRVDKELRRRAAARGMSLNALLLELMREQTGVAEASPARNGLRRFAGTWVEDRAVDRALAEQRAVDRRDWE